MTRKKRKNVLAREIRQNTDLDFVQSMKVAKVATAPRPDWNRVREEMEVVMTAIEMDSFHCSCGVCDPETIYSWSNGQELTWPLKGLVKDFFWQR